MTEPFCRGSIFWSENNMPLHFPKMIFFPRSCNMSFFNSDYAFYFYSPLFCIYFTHLFHFFRFLSPSFFFYLFPGFLFLLIIFFPQLTTDILPPKGGGVFPLCLTSVVDPHQHPHDFGLLDPHSESTFQMLILEADSKCEFQRHSRCGSSYKICITNTIINIML
jgi:hypothetical protein